MDQNQYIFRTFSVSCFMTTSQNTGNKEKDSKIRVCVYICALLITSDRSIDDVKLPKNRIYWQMWKMEQCVPYSLSEMQGNTELLRWRLHIFLISDWRSQIILGIATNVPTFLSYDLYFSLNSSEALFSYINWYSYLSKKLRFILK